MRKSIKEILDKYNNIDSHLLDELNTLYLEAMFASKELGKRSKQLSDSEESRAWNEIYTGMVEFYQSDESAFAELNFQELKQKYGIYLRGRRNK